MNCSNLEIDHEKPISSFYLLKNEGRREAFNWINTQALVEEDHLHQATNCIFLDYRL